MKLTVDIEIWSEIAEESPLAWEGFVRWFEKHHPATFNHSDCWVEEITTIDLKWFFNTNKHPTTLNNGLDIVGAFQRLEGSLEKIKEGNRKFEDIFNGVKDVLNTSGIMGTTATGTMDATGTEKMS